MLIFIQTLPKYAKRRTLKSSLIKKNKRDGKDIY